MYSDKEIDIITIGGYTEDEILNNKNCSKDPQFWYNIKGTDRYLFKSDVAESWEYFDPLIENPVRNTNVIYLRFLNSGVFTTEADHFKRYGYYTNSLPETFSYESYWDRQEELCSYGLEVEGVRIPGRFYFLLNFGRLKARTFDPVTKKESKRKIETFFRFIDHQYYLSLEVEENFLEGLYSNIDTYLRYFPNKNEDNYKGLRLQNLTVVKSRRLGFTYFVDNACYAYNMNFLTDSKNFLFAYEKSHYETTLSGIHLVLNFINNNTAWAKRRKVLDKRDHFRTSFVQVDENGIEVEVGYKSEFEATSFKDNPFKGIGASADFIGVEEVGKFSNILTVYPISIEPLIRDGEIATGVSIMWGTSGDMEGGGSVGLSKIAYNPESYNQRSYNNIYDDKATGSVGYFMDDLWYSPSQVLKEDILKYADEDTIEILNKLDQEFINCVDDEGNSYRRFVKVLLINKRKAARKADSVSYNKLITQQPLTLSEAFLLNESSPFDTVILKEQLSVLKTKAPQGDTGVFNIDKDGNIVWQLDFSLNAIVDFPLRDDKHPGCWVMYKRPESDNGYARYVAGFDPIDFGYDESSDSSKHSLASTFIMDSLTREIVAEYTGRPRISEIYYENLWRGIEYYKAELLYENNLKGAFSYFRNKNKLHLLAYEPQSLKNRTNYKENNSIKGFRATAEINSLARDLIASWLLEEYVTGQNEEGGMITVPRAYSILSVPLLQELILWNKKGNFDRVSSLGATMLLLQDRKIYLNNKNETINDRFEDKFFSAGRNFLKNNKWK